ncbi:MAG: glycosyltransferase family 39 protein [Desulfobacteraceae bacterium]|nr:glycosyltransferase family 39 protein [Desulfobacteraceae bacterium]
MLASNDTRWIKLCWLLIGAGALARFFYAQSFLLVPDETNYWQWARHLDWGYHDQAPLIAWAIHLTTWLFGQTEAAVRLPSIIALTIASVYIVSLAKRWLSARLAWQATLLGQSILLFNIGALLATPDGIQAAAWAGASYHAARAFEDNQWRHWLLGGVWFGLGMLSKFTMVLFLPCILAYALFTNIHRQRMAGVRPYLGCAFGVAMFVPVIVWNAAHHWNSVRHVAYIGGANQGFVLHPNLLIEYLGSQAALLTPLVFLIVCAGWFKAIRGRYSKEEWVSRYLFFTSFPVIAGFGILSLHSRVYGNWPGVGYVTAVLLATTFFSSSNNSATEEYASSIGSTREIWKWTVGSSYLLTALLLGHVLFGFLPVPAHLDRAADEIQGWDLLGQRVGQIRAEMPNQNSLFLFGLHYQIASELAFYVPGQPYTVSINRWTRPNVYDYWWQDKDLLGYDAVGVHFDDHSRERLLEVFERVDAPEAFNIFRSNLWDSAAAKKTPFKTLYIYRCYGFKGGLRWVPPANSVDVRATAP